LDVYSLLPGVSTEGRGSIGSHPSDMGVTGSKARLISFSQ